MREGRFLAEASNAAISWTLTGATARRVLTAIGADIAVILAFTAAALVGGALTPRRRTR